MAVGSALSENTTARAMLVSPSNASHVFWLNFTV
jgi:hypothetical protein